MTVKLTFAIVCLVFTFVFLPSSFYVVTRVKGKSSLGGWHFFTVPNYTVRFASEACQVYQSTSIGLSADTAHSLVAILE